MPKDWHSQESIGQNQWRTFRCFPCIVESQGLYNKDTAHMGTREFNLHIVCIYMCVYEKRFKKYVTQYQQWTRVMHHGIWIGNAGEVHMMNSLRTAMITLKIVDLKPKAHRRSNAHRSPKMDDMVHQVDWSGQTWNFTYDIYHIYVVSTCGTSP